MRTENLVEALVADGASRRRPMPWLVAGALGLGGLASLAVFLVEYGVRENIVRALATWRFDLKLALVLSALVLAFALCLSLSRPVPSSRPRRYLLLMAALAAIAVAVELAASPGTSWGARLVGSNAAICLVAIPVLSIVPLAVVLVALRAAAPASPALAGGAAGLLAAAAGATLYAFHCFDDSPLFVVTWYSMAAIPVVAVGAAIGRFVLRW